MYKIKIFNTELISGNDSKVEFEKNVKSYDFISCDRDIELTCENNKTMIICLARNDRLIIEEI